MMARDAQTLKRQRLYRWLQRKLPLREVRIAVGEREWSVIAARSQDDLLETVQTDGDLQRFPYGLLLWTSAVGLARRLAVEPALVRGKTVLELGAGVGLPGMVAQALGAQVTQTDYQADALNLARINALRNGVEGVRYLLADWREFYPVESYDVIIGSDVLYERTLHADLARILRRVLAPGGMLLLADPLRPQAVEFMSRLEGEGWRIEMEGLTVAWQEETREIAFFRGRLRH
ncbi:MAG TPA: methyltransferase domain-containing protein [Chthonomonadales bacterium]|nr:methyltransferase domain-containing protein [Chthonomonadales bacterium]